MNYLVWVIFELKKIFLSGIIVFPKYNNVLWCTFGLGRIVVVLLMWSPCHSFNFISVTPKWLKHFNEKSCFLIFAFCNRHDQCFEFYIDLHINLASGQICYWLNNKILLNYIRDTWSSMQMVLKLPHNFEWPWPYWRVHLKVTYRWKSSKELGRYFTWDTHYKYVLEYRLPSKC